MDDDEMYCECVSPTISSLDPDFENEGYQAAAELDQMLRRKPHSSRPAKTITSPARNVVERESTSPIPTSALLAQRALAFITTYAHTGIMAIMFRKRCGVSLSDYRNRQR